MIKHIESETVKIKSIGDDRIEIFFVESVSGGSVSGITLTVDELSDLKRMVDLYWDVNNLWRQTSEAKADRASCDYLSPLIGRKETANF